MFQRNNGQYANTPEGDLFLDCQVKLFAARHKPFGLLMCLNMLIEIQAGIRLHRRGLQRLDAPRPNQENTVEPLCGPDSTVVGIK